MAVAAVQGVAKATFGTSDVPKVAFATRLHGAVARLTVFTTHDPRTFRITPRTTKGATIATNSTSAAQPPKPPKPPSS